MDNSFPQQGSDTQQSGRLLPRFQFFVSLVDWLVGFIRLTEEEQKDAGVYLDETR